MKKLVLGFAIAALSMASPAASETLNNRSIVELHASGLDDETIIAKIESSDANFDLSTSALVALKKQGVPSRVITAMLQAQNRTRGPGPITTPPSGVRSSSASADTLAVSRPAGIYLLSNGQLQRIDFNVSGQTKTGGFLGSALSYGIAKISVKVVLQGESARVRTHDETPTFYFYLPAAVARSGSSSFTESSSEPSSPNDFSLIRLERKGGSREARIGRGNITGFQSGVVSKDRVNIIFDEVRPGVFVVRPESPLAMGEYSFVMIGAGGASVAKFFDFSVQ
ncbi:MAG TPA: hypothetical protein VFW19_09425 [Allosphingosinicella sp.]|nr:hypothetical protein [Allosphingosinicella sp.]